MTTPDLLTVLRAGEPVLPLTRGQAAAQAFRLRMKHRMSYTAIARLMGEYHGIWLGEASWRRACVQRGAPRNENKGFRTVPADRHGDLVA